MAFAEEKDFEKALIELLSTKGWEKDVLRFPTEEDLIQNWANILFENNREKDRLNDYRLTRTEMQQLIEQIIALKTPFKLNEFINGKTVSIVRDNPDAVSYTHLDVYKRQETFIVNLTIEFTIHIFETTDRNIEIFILYKNTFFNKTWPLL